MTVRHSHDSSLDDATRSEHEPAPLAELGDEIQLFLGRFDLDSDVRRTGQGRTLLGGSPFRLLRVSGAGSDLIDLLVAGELLPASGANRKLVAQLVEGGLAHPAPLPRWPALGEVTVVIPVHEDVDGLRHALDALFESYPDIAVVVVDDGSAPSEAVRIAEVVGQYDTAQLQRLQQNRGPAAARNLGWQLANTPLIAFLDADVVGANWLRPLLGHFDDESVGAVAPRVSAPNPQRLRHSGSTKPASVLSRYERVRSALDMGHRPGRVAPGMRVSYAPAAALLVRRSALEAVDGFDESLRYGEDVDLLWRLDANGHRVRYEPSARVEHRNRSTWQTFADQRAAYGSAAAALEHRHPGAVAPVRLSAPLLGTWVLVALGGKKGAAVAGVLGAKRAVDLRTKLRNHVDDPFGEARHLTLRAHRQSGKWLAAALTRTWLPASVVGSVFSRRFRRAMVAAIVIPAAEEWFTDSPDLDLGRWTAARFFDDASYCAGVWQGALDERSVRALLPKVTLR